MAVYSKLGQLALTEPQPVKFCFHFHPILIFFTDVFTLVIMTKITIHTIILILDKELYPQVSFSLTPIGYYCNKEDPILNLISNNNINQAGQMSQISKDKSVH